MPLRLTELRARILPIGLSQGVGIVCGVIGVRIVSRLIPPDALGAYGVFLTFTTLGASLVHSGLIKFVGRHWARGFNRRPFVANVGKAWIRKLPWLLAGTFIAAGALQRAGQGNFTTTFPALFIATVGLSVGAIAQTGLQAVRRHWADFFVSASGSLTRTFAPPVLYLLFGGAMAGLYFGFCIHALCVALLGLFCLRPQAATSPEATDSTVSSVYAGPLFFVLSSAGWLLMGLNRWISVAFFGETVGGFYTLAGNMAQIIPAVLGAITLQYLQPIFYALADQATSEATRRLVRLVDLAAFGVAIAGITALLLLRWVAPVLVGPLIDPKYTAALAWIIPAGSFGLTIVVGQFYHVMLLAARRERACAPVDLTTAAVLILGSILTAWRGPLLYQGWLMATPAVALLLTRTLARQYFFRALPSRSPIAVGSSR